MDNKKLPESNSNTEAQPACKKMIIKSKTNIISARSIERVAIPEEEENDEQQER